LVNVGVVVNEAALAEALKAILSGDVDEPG
jgi:hypothetical protein